MFRTCLHCHAALGANETLEAFPVGRRVAFDAKRGRLWVVCRKCERWNLSPFDARWEALDQAERAFRATRVRVSTDNIGLARMPDGTDLVRIGAPMRPEFAAWRYGDQFGRRRVRAAMIGGGIAIGGGLAIAGVAASGIAVAAFVPIVHLITISAAIASTQGGKPLPHPDGGQFKPIGLPRLIDSDRAAGWAMEIGYLERFEMVNGRRVVTEPRERGLARQNGVEVGRVVLHGADAVPLLRQTLPTVNRGGAGRSTVADGVRLIEDAGGPERFGRWAASQRRIWGARQTFGDTGDLQYIPAPARLAFEMALHEDSERAALEGELTALARAWEDAEQIAAISDTLTIPAAIEARWSALRKLKKT